MPDLSRPIIVCRPALPKDTPQVRALTRTIWDGHDYVPVVWEEWLADSKGWLAVAEYGGRVAGTCKLSHLAGDQWWLQGLRVDPELQGRGIARRLHNYTVAIWQEHMRGVLRLGTMSTRLAVQHLSLSTGFQQVGEYSWFLNELHDCVEAISPFEHLVHGEMERALEFALRSGSLAFTGGLMDLGWEWAEVDETLLSAAGKDDLIWWWRGNRGLLAAWIDKEPGEPDAFMVSLLACVKEDLALFLQDICYLALSTGYRRAGWVAPLIPEVVAALEMARYQRIWEQSLYLYALDRRGAQ